MSTTGRKNAGDLVKAAFRTIGVLAADEALEAPDFEVGLDTLNLMLKEWQNHRYNLWTVAEATLTLTTAASYTLDPARPIRIHGARFVGTSSETPMTEMTRADYDALPVKTSTGVPTQFYYDRQREDARFYVWPVLAVAAGETVKLTCEREIDDMAEMSSPADVPGEWWSAVVYNLADRLADPYERNVPRVTARAQMLLDLALSSDAEESVFF